MMAWIEKRTELDILLLENISQLKDDVSNCQKFAQQLSFGVDIFVNDSFSEVHKILASTVGIACFCSACIAGFHFQLGLSQLEKINRTDKKPYVAIIGGGNLIDKAAALHFLASICDALVFVGEMAFQIMHAFGLPVPIKFVERKGLKQAHAIVEAAKARNIEIVLPKDFWCINYSNPHQMEISSASSILDGWKPVDLGPSTLEEISSFLSKFKKIMWIGPVKFSSSNLNAGGASKLAAMIDALSQRNCDVSIVGKMACDAFHGNSSSATAENMIQNASVVWEFLKGRNLPGLLALDRAYPFEMDWKSIYNDPDRPLVVDIGSGNGLFLFGMARRRKDFNSLGLEINRKLVKRCLDHVSQSLMKNVHFVATNATSTFRSIISSYPGRLVLVSIQCPNPDFNKPEHRWRMLQRSLVEAIADLLASGGKVFLQSDIEEVAIRMKEEFSKYGKGKLTVENLDKAAIHQGGWLKENPFGIRSDWEQHVLDRGDPMYRLCLSKSESSG
ncbi:phosphoglycerate kinase isoform X3 [Ipomoea triloba]|nr:phosphoglycerate kinase isoform X3 [Ipomoea triloba]